MNSLDDRPLSPFALSAAGVVILVTVAGVGLHQWIARGEPSVASSATAPATQIGVRSLRFLDAGDGLGAYGGHVRVFDARSGHELPELAENEGFIRTVLNGLVFERTKQRIEAEPVFELSVWSDNKVVLKDPATGAEVILGQFGAKNRDAFLRFFRKEEASR